MTLKGAVASLGSYASAPLTKLPLEEQKPTVQLTAGSLWRESPAVIYVVRRPGCVLCRAEATKLYEIKPKLDELGVSLVAVLHENIPEQVAEFQNEYWPSSGIYLDTEKKLYEAVGGGEVRRGSLLSFLNPFSPVWANYKEANVCVKTSNLTGEGTHMGGLFVVKKGTGEVVYSYQEKNFGDHAPSADVVAAAESALRG